MRDHSDQPEAQQSLMETHRNQDHLTCQTSRRHLAEKGQAETYSPAFLQAGRGFYLANKADSLLAGAERLGSASAHHGPSPLGEMENIDP